MAQSAQARGSDKPAALPGPTLQATAAEPRSPLCRDELVAGLRKASSVPGTGSSCRCKSPDGQYIRSLFAISALVTISQ